MYLRAADIALATDATPAASGFAGTLLADVARGTQDLTFTAIDSGGPGVYAVTAQIDGRTVYSGTPDANGGRCSSLGTSEGRLMFDSAQPCKQSESVDVPLNTATLADGSHSLKVIVEDAAKSSSVVYAGTITTQNATVNSTLGALPGPGASGASGALVSGVGAPNGPGASEGAQLRLGLRNTISRTYAHRGLRITGRLLNAHGQPIAGASLGLAQQVAGASRAQALADVSSGADGSFVAVVGVGASRTITVSYRAFSADVADAARASVKESVGAGIKLSVTPRHTSSTGMILLSGRVRGRVPRQGVIVDLLVHYRGRWEPFRTPRTDAAGQFVVPYQFEGALGRFPFRAEVPGSQADFSFARGVSEVVDVATY